LKYIRQLNGRQNNYDLGYRLLQRHWSKGYGTELALACINYGFRELQLSRISAYADVRHVASVKILEKCGLKLTNTFMDEGDLCGWYEIANPA
jgi:ribosomal-protein-alanine N-acetyltransferase